MKNQLPIDRPYVVFKPVHFNTSFLKKGFDQQCRTRLFPTKGRCGNQLPEQLSCLRRKLIYVIIRQCMHVPVFPDRRPASSST